MKGQWIGYYQGSAEGRVMINVDEVDDHYEGAAYLNPTTRCIPATVAYLSTINKDHEQVATAYMIIFLEFANMIQALSSKAYK
ncbi:MAG: hypothetical protein H3C64_04860 [Candidatus Kuenenia stuttgartiensis]|uniref:Uncharacterized protein n=1 Tax=Kuenenia stuttgartiensis TaxID=174633 RepID=A0A2C9CEM4_KUEST|nr:hypothetical protein [Candidatus Kuenenia stuttgartiensis]MBW7941729.1 hypothetical protein [Candidatus Kuenenia stuttgartiensis]SOH04151.1 hypothetical protein KSMBR1_1652 [Candidatus Kuenenia stuttgartiensis]